MHLDEHFTEVPEGKHALAIIDETGDTKVIWDPNNEDEVDAAKAQFKALKKKGYLAYAVKGKDGAKGEQIHEFDPEAGRIILAPALQGG